MPPLQETKIDRWVKSAIRPTVWLVEKALAQCRPAPSPIALGSPQFVEPRPKRVFSRRQVFKGFLGFAGGAVASVASAIATENIPGAEKLLFSSSPNKNTLQSSTTLSHPALPLASADGAGSNQKADGPTETKFTGEVGQTRDQLLKWKKEIGTDTEMAQNRKAILELSFAYFAKVNNLTEDQKNQLGSKIEYVDDVSFAKAVKRDSQDPDTDYASWPSLWDGKYFFRDSGLVIREGPSVTRQFFTHYRVLHLLFPPSDPRARIDPAIGRIDKSMGLVNMVWYGAANTYYLVGGGLPFAFSAYATERGLSFLDIDFDVDPNTNNLARGFEQHVIKDLKIDLNTLLPFQRQSDQTRFYEIIGERRVHSESQRENYLEGVKYINRFFR